MPETRGRTSETRVGAMRPGSSRTTARDCGLTTTMLTSGSAGGAAEMAELDSSQPASSGAKAASIIATHADRARSPDMKWGAPMLLKLIKLRASPFWTIPAADGANIDWSCCDATHQVGGSMSHALSD